MGIIINKKKKNQMNKVLIALVCLVVV